MKMNSINITSKITASLQQKLSLKPGQIIKAQVVKSEGKQVLLQLGTNILKAQTKVPLSTGDRLQLQVESAKNNSIELRIVNEKIQFKPEDAVLAKLGLKPQEGLFTVFRQMAKHNLPVSQVAIMELFKLVNGYKLDDEMTEVMVWLKTVGVKVESEKDINALQTLQKFLKGESPIDEEDRFFAFLNEKETIIYGGCNIFAWPVAGQHVFLLTPGSKRERLEPENCKLLLQLDSQSFGELWFNIELARNKMKAELICNDKKYQPILSKEAGELCQTLQAAGYKIEYVEVEVINKKLTVLDFIPQHAPHLFDINYQI